MHFIQSDVMPSDLEMYCSLKKNYELKKMSNCSTNLADTKLSELFGAHILKVACILQKMSLYNAIRLFQIQSGLVYPAHNNELVINAQCQRWRDINQSIFAVGSTQPHCNKINSEVIKLLKGKRQHSLRGPCTLWLLYQEIYNMLMRWIHNSCFHKS
jgi:hypothetical protein